MALYRQKRVGTLIPQGPYVQLHIVSKVLMVKKMMMKTRIYPFSRLSVACCLASMLLLCSCNEWLDVSPKTQIKSDDNFTTEQGYKDALTGVYLLMGSTSAYGQELTYGMLDAMAQYYTGMASSNPYNYDAAYDYSNSGVESRINGIWTQMYSAIANDNELIQRIDEASPLIFTGRNYHLIRGEAYAIRALLHFDLTRLWGAPYLVNPQHKCIPYMKTVTADVTPLSTVREALDNCLADLSVAEAELQDDPVVRGTIDNADVTYERDRTFKMNYYAVCLLMARIHLYMGNYEAAFHT